MNHFEHYFSAGTLQVEAEMDEKVAMEAMDELEALMPAAISSIPM